MSQTVHAGAHEVFGTARRDSFITIGTAVVLCAWLATYASTYTRGSSGAGVMIGAAALVGIGLVAAAGWSVAARAGRRSSPADRVTLARTVLIGGCATIAVLILAGPLQARPWWLIALAAPALALDGVDGFVARRTGTSSAAGARLDMEMDAALLLVLSVVAVASLGPWVLTIGLMRYVFAFAFRFRPQLRAPLAFSQFRRVVAAIQGVALVVALAPVVPVPLAQVVLAGALALLVVSFGRDVIGLERRGRRPTG